ncbi:hypothetical protein VPH35_129951 [Triticum aestivum]
MRRLRSANFTLVGTSRRGLRLMTWKHCTRRFMLPFVLILPWQNQPRNLRRRTRGRYILLFIKVRQLNSTLPLDCKLTGLFAASIISRSIEVGTQLAMYVMLQLKIKMLSIQ